MLLFMALSLLLVALTTPASLQAAARPTPSPTVAKAKVAPPSILMIVVDTLRPDYLGCYGFRGDISPNIDALCKQAVVFEQAYAQAPWTKPSVATLLSSLDPIVHQVLTYRGQNGKAEVEPGVDGAVSSDVLAESITTLPEVLQQAGYATAAVIANPAIRKEVGFAQGFETYLPNFAENAYADVLATTARDWIEQQPAERPFFLYLHLMDVQEPYHAAEDDFAAIKDSVSLGADRAIPAEQLSKDLLRGLRRIDAHWAEPDRPERLQLRTWRGRYGAAVRSLDRRLKPLLEYAGSSPRGDNLMVILTSDHGEELFEHGGWDHGTSLYEHQLHVPLIIRPPGGLEGGKRVDGLIGLIDVAPTITSIAGAKPPASWRGRSFSGLVRGPGRASGQDVLFASGVKRKPAMTSVRTRRYKLIRDRDAGKEMLFNLATDPRELNDGRARNGAIAGELRIPLEGYAKRAAPVRPSPKPGR